MPASVSWNSLALKEVQLCVDERRKANIRLCSSGFCEALRGMHLLATPVQIEITQI